MPANYANEDSTEINRGRRPFTLHVKITEHFMLALEERPMGPEASLDLWHLLSGRELHRIAHDLERGRRGALAVAGDGQVHLIVFCRDEADPAVVALLTVLSGRTARKVTHPPLGK